MVTRLDWAKLSGIDSVLALASQVFQVEISALRRGHKSEFPLYVKRHPIRNVSLL